MTLSRLPSIRAAEVALVLVVLAGCTAVRVETPDPAAVPAGPLEAQRGDASGPVVELGSGVNAGLGWRYSIYPSGDEWCTQLETIELTVSACGAILPADDHAFGSIGRGQPLTGGVTPVEGIVTAETATVWLVNEGGFRMPAKLMSLEGAGLEGQAFVGFVPPDVTISHVQAVAISGEVLETYELP
jgi:hypothetical protein